MPAIDVLFVPDSSRGNPYQRALADGLANHGVRTRLARGSGPFPVLAAIRQGPIPRILHLHWIHTYLISSGRVRSTVKGVRFLAELLVARRLGVRIVWTVHNLLSHDSPFPGMEATFKRGMIRLFDRLIVHCSAAREGVLETFHLPGHFERKVVVIPHGHYLNCYPNTVSPEEARRRLDLPEDSVVLLFFGKIRPYKGVFELIEQFRRLDVKGAQLVIAGRPVDDDTEARLMACCNQNSRIHCHPRFIADDQIQAFMNAADGAVFPYDDILTSGALILAMSFGKAVVAPRLGCIPELVDDKGGLLYDPADGPALQQAIRSALDVDLAQMGKRNLHVVRRLDWDTISRQTRAVYDECLGENRR
jgi:glycosyltransferase involved in cell wall biosynthesis